MRTSDSSTKRLLLEAAKEEFYQNGYEKASLRKICARAGVTTGAFYFFFQSKEEIFRELIEKAYSAIWSLTSRLSARELIAPESGVENEKEMIPYLFQYKRELLILIHGARGTSYQSYWEHLRHQMEELFTRFFEQFSGTKPDSELIRILVCMKMQGYIELLSGGYTMEQAVKLAGYLGYYTDGGFRILTEECKKENHIEKTDTQEM